MVCKFLKANKICGCSNDIEETFLLDNNDCDIRCEGQPRYCGGADAFSVYMS